VIQAFAAAARRAKAAGFDGVEVHAAHYYLLSQFLSPYANRRQDRWGGDPLCRVRIGVEVTRAIRDAVGPRFPVFCRMHGVERFEGGMSTEDAITCGRAFAAAGVDVIDASAIGQASFGSWEGQSYLNTSSVLPKGAPPGAFAPFAGRLRQALGVPVIAVGKMGEPGVAQRALDEGQADLVAIARQLIADPCAAEKLLAGRDGEIERCQECLTCFAAIRKGPLKCRVNRAL
jgi:NADPH2 dehydrogenase